MNFTEFMKISKKNWRRIWLI